MTNTSQASSASSVNIHGVVCARPHGTPSKCWCGCPAILKTSRSDPNPGRRYFRCSMAAKNLLMNDNHCFKWMDEALFEDLQDLKEANHSLHMMIQGIQEELQMMEKRQDEADLKLKKTVAVAVVLCLGISCVFKFL